MSDIVERLLSDKWQPSVDLELLCVEAAGEIKRLRLENKICAFDITENGITLMICPKDAEIERLRDALQSIAKHVEANAQTSALAKAIFVTCNNALNKVGTP